MAHRIFEQPVRAVLWVVSLSFRPFTLFMGTPGFREDHYEFDVLERTRCAQEAPRNVPSLRISFRLGAYAGDGVDIAAGLVRLKQQR